MFLINLIQFENKYITNDDRDIFERMEELKNYDAELSEFPTLSTALRVAVPSPRCE